MAINQCTTQRNQWIYMKNKLFCVIDEPEGPRIVTCGTDYSKRNKTKQLEAKLKLTNMQRKSLERQQNAWREIFTRRTVQLPSQLQIDVDTDEGSQKDRKFLEQTRSSIRNIMDCQSHVVHPVKSASIQRPGNPEGIAPSVQKVGMVPVQSPLSLNTHSATKCGQLQYENLMDITIDRNEIRRNLSAATSVRTLPEWAKKDEKEDFNEGECIDDYIDNFCEDILKEEIVNEDVNNNEYTNVENDDIITYHTSRPTTRMSTASLPDTEGSIPYDLSKKETPYSTTTGNDDTNAESSEDTTKANDTAGCNYLPLSRGGRKSSLLPRRKSSLLPSSPTWPCVIDIQRLRSGGYRYRESTKARSKTSKKGGIELTDKQIQLTPRRRQRIISASIANMAKPAEDVPNRAGHGTIIIPSHANVDCPLCDLYSQDMDHKVHSNNKTAKQKSKKSRIKEYKMGIGIGYDLNDLTDPSDSEMMTPRRGKNSYPMEAFPARRPRSSKRSNMDRSRSYFPGSGVGTSRTCMSSSLDNIKFRKSSIDSHQGKFSYVSYNARRYYVTTNRPGFVDSF